MTTCESLLGLDKEGWLQISQMDEAQLAVYLQPITDLERTSRVVNVYGESNESEEVQETNEGVGNSSEDNPFTKAKNKTKKVKKPRRLLSTYDADQEAKNLAEELEGM